MFMRMMTAQRDREFRRFLEWHEHNHNDEMVRHAHRQAVSTGSLLMIPTAAMWMTGFNPTAWVATKVGGAIASSMWNSVWYSVTSPFSYSRSDADGKIQSLEAIGANVNVNALIESSKRNGLFIAMSTCMSALAAMLAYMGSKHKEVLLEKDRKKLNDASGDDSLTKMWKNADNQLNPLTHILNFLMGAMNQINAMAGRDDATTFGGLTHAIDLVFSWQVIARLLELYNIEPLAIASQTMAALFTSGAPPARKGFLGFGR